MVILLSSTLLGQDWSTEKLRAEIQPVGSEKQVSTFFGTFLFSSFFDKSFLKCKKKNQEKKPRENLRRWIFTPRKRGGKNPTVKLREKRAVIPDMFEIRSNFLLSRTKENLQRDVQAQIILPGALLMDWGAARREYRKSRTYSRQKSTIHRKLTLPKYDSN